MEKFIQRAKRILSKALFLALHSSYKQLIIIDWKEYLHAYPDVKGTIFNAAYHYFKYGKTEGRSTTIKIKNHTIKEEFCLSQEQRKELGISYIVLAYNSQNYIVDCVRSIISQLDSEDEVVIVDDGSSDSTIQKISPLMASEKKIKLVCHKQNRGLLEAHRSGVKVAKNNYLSYIDGDDQILSFFGSTAKKLIYNNQPDVICFRWIRSLSEVSNEEKNQRGRIINFKKLKNCNFFHYFRSSNSINIHIGLNRKLFKKEIIAHALSMNIPNVLYWEDLCVQTLVNQTAKVILVTETAPYIWFERASSVSTKTLTDKWFFDTEASLNFVSKMIKDKDCLKRLKKAQILDGLERIKESTSIDEAEKLTKKIGEIFKFEDISDQNWLRTEIGKAICRSYVPQKGSGILLVDHADFPLLKKEFSELLNSFLEAKIELANVSISESDNLEEYIDRVCLAQKHKLIVTSAGWWGPDFITNRPVVQLWHGVGLLKKVSPITLPIISNPLWGICSSTKIQPEYAELFGLGLHQVFPLGGVLANKIAGLRAATSTNYEGKKTKVKKTIILYCPTFRLVNWKYVTPNFIDLQKIDKSLNEDEILVIRLHPRTETRDIYKSGLKRIFFSQNEDIATDLSTADYFITDYSSSLWYACLLDKPLFFWVPDLHEYRNGNRGIMLSFEDGKMPGEVISSSDFHNVLEAIRDYNNEETRFKYSRLREKFREDFLSGCNPGNTRKICQKIKLTYSLFE